MFGGNCARIQVAAQLEPFSATGLPVGIYQSWHSFDSLLRGYYQFSLMKTIDHKKEIA